MTSPRPEPSSTPLDHATLDAAAEPALLWAPQAWLHDGHGRGAWQSGVVLRVGADGRWADVDAGVAEPPRDATVLDAVVLPGLVDAHGHAFQRAFAGLAERRDARADDFWSWRDRMYRVALRVTPETLRAVAAQLNVELLAGGYTQVCEFHYLHHRDDGTPHDDPLAMAWALADAADDAGIGVTLLPVLYERAGFAQPALRDDQRRFRADARWVWEAAQRIAAARRPRLSAGVAVHSLRAAAPESIAGLRALVHGWDGPIHVHAAEQAAEVDDCVAALGARPIEWLAREGRLDARWQLVHATHATRDEIAAVALSGAGIVICPTTEANLGDGVADLAGWLDADVPVAIGSDSHVGRDWREELRWLDYGQRLARRQRNVAAAPERGRPSTAARLFDHAVAAGGRAAGQPSWGLRRGARADLLVADPRDPALLGIAPGRRLDAIVFSAPARPWRDVMVAGRWAMRNGVHPRAEAIAARFAEAMRALHGDG